MNENTTLRISEALALPSTLKGNTKSKKANNMLASNANNVAINCDIPLTPGKIHTIKAEAMSLGTDNALGDVKSEFTISYKYYEDDKVLMVYCNDDIVKEPTRISFTNADGKEIMGNSKWEPHTLNNVEKNEMLCGSSNAPTDEFEESLIQTTKNIRTSLLEQCKDKGITVVSYPPIAVYKNGCFDGTYNPDADYGDEYDFAMVGTTSVTVDMTTFTVGKEFANVIGSSDDPKPGAYEVWMELYDDVVYTKRSFKLPTRKCETDYSYHQEWEYKIDKGKNSRNESDCISLAGRTISGGHVILGREPKSVAKGGKVFIIPICQSHNKKSALRRNSGGYNQFMKVGQVPAILVGATAVPALVLTGYDPNPSKS